MMLIATVIIIVLMFFCGVGPVIKLLAQLGFYALVFGVMVLVLLDSAANVGG